MGQPLEVHIRKLQEFYWSESDPDGRGFVPLADALRKAGEFQEARRVLREGLRRHPEFLAGHVVSAWLSLDEGNLNQAKIHYNDALDLDPRNVAVLRGLSELHLTLGDEEKAISYLEALLKEDPVDLDLPERLNELRDRLAAEEAQADQQSVALAIWDDPVRAADELNFHHATLQPDVSPPASAEEEEPDEEVPVAEVPVEEPAADEVEEPMAELDAPDAEAAPDPPVLIVEDGEPIPEAGDLENSLVTSTLGEIYLRQGLLGRAEWVFESLLEEDPENDHLKERLAEVQELLAVHGPRKESTIHPTDPSDSEPEVPVVEILDSADASVEGWVPGDVPEEADLEGPTTTAPDLDELDQEVIPIEALAPDRTEPVRTEPREPESQEPAFEVLPVGELAPNEVSPGSHAPEAVSVVDDFAPDEILTIEPLAPANLAGLDALGSEEIVDDDALAPDEIITVEALAPEEIVPVGDSVFDQAEGADGPADLEIISIDALAPEEFISIDALAPDEFISIDDLAPDQIVSIDALAPEDFISIDELAPDPAQPAGDGRSRGVVPIGDLAPGEPVPIEALAPDAEDDSASDPTVDDFERWLDKLK